MRMALRLVPTPLPDPNPQDTLGERIKSAYGFRRMTQQDVVDGMEAAGERVGVKPPALRTFSDWVADKTSPTVRQLGLLAQALDTTADWFVRDMVAPDPDDGGSVMRESSSACTSSAHVIDITDRVGRSAHLPVAA